MADLDAAFLRGMATVFGIEADEHSQKAATRLRDIADRLDVKTEEFKCGVTDPEKMDLPWRYDTSRYFAIAKTPDGGIIPANSRVEQSRIEQAYTSGRFSAKPKREDIDIIVKACRDRQKMGGESDEMLTRWIAEALTELIYG